MPATIYIDGATKAVTTTEPELTGRAVITVAIPDGLPVSILTSQLSTLTGTLISPAAEAVVVAVTIG